MKTEDLIAAMAADTTPAQGPGTRLVRALPPALALSLAALVLLWHLRPDLLAVLSSAAALKTLTPVALALAALWLAR
ncbi:MAG: RNA polymerase subunit sigma-70, partial [Rhodobacteraceae bacterium]|nr:RNA polymerase subunit sigma-70 [Paracoccaceae bacterium]